MLKTESYKRGIIKSTVLNVIVKCISFITTLIIAYYFGITVETDLYFYVFSTITLIASLINGMDLTVIIPEGMQLEQKEGRAAAMLFYNSFAYLYLIIGVVLFVILFLFSVPVYSTVSAFKNTVLNEHRYLLIVSSTLPLFLILSNYLTSVLTTLKYFTAPLIANGIAYILALTALTIFHKSSGISAVFIGLVAGYILNVILLLTFMYLKLNWRFGFSVKDLSKRVKKNLLSVQLGNLATFAFNYGIIILLSSLAAGVYSAYNYSMQVVNIPIIFIVAQTSSVAGIKFNELAARRLHTELNKIFQDSIGVLLLLQEMVQENLPC
jgi:putative peptidoglycan lipid II flippase